MKQNRMLAFFNHKVRSQADEMASVNTSLEKRVEAQVDEIERLARLTRFLPGDVADLITSESRESLL